MGRGFVHLLRDGGVSRGRRLHEKLYAAEEIDLFRRLKRLAQKRHRSIVILHRHPLLTSARKAHLYTIRELLRFWARTVLSGGRTAIERSFPSRWAAMKTAIGVPTAAEFAPAFERYVARVRQVADPLGELSVQRARFLARLSPLTEEQAQFRYAPDKWSVKDLLGHLCDAERVFAYRLLRIGRRHHAAAGVRGNRLRPRRGCAPRPFRDLLGEWSVVRDSTTALAASLPETDWLNTGTRTTRRRRRVHFCTSSSATPNIIWLCWRIDTESVEVFFRSYEANLTTGVAGAAIVAASLSSLTAQDQASGAQAAPAAAQEQGGGRGGRAGGGRGGGRGGAAEASALRAIPAETIAASKDANWQAPRTPWGHPDIQGTWSSDDMRGIHRSGTLPRVNASR